MNINSVTDFEVGEDCPDLSKFDLDCIRSQVDTDAK